MHVEFEWKDRIESIENVFVLPKLEIQPTISGGWGQIVNFL